MSINIRIDFQTNGPKRGFWVAKWEERVVRYFPNELVFTFGGSYVSTNFGENRLRNATVRVLADGQIYTLTH